MLPSFLIISGYQSDRTKTAEKLVKKILGSQFSLADQHPDLIRLETDGSVKIDQIRNLKKQLQSKPYSARAKVALIPTADKLTLPAQNALLKILEEPPAKTSIILIATQKESLLPTIISRCQIIQLVQTPQIEIEKQNLVSYSNLLSSVLSARVGERLKIAESYQQREKAIKLVEALLWLWREILLTQASIQKKSLLKGAPPLTLQQISQATKDTEKSRLMLAANVHPRLAIENLFLGYPNLVK
jgi:DNA polymerase III delta prime subunit